MRPMERSKCKARHRAAGKNTLDLEIFVLTGIKKEKCVRHGESPTGKLYGDVAGIDSICHGLGKRLTIERILSHQPSKAAKILRITFSFGLDNHFP